MSGEVSDVEEAIDSGIEPDWTNPMINVSQCCIICPDIIF